VAEPLVSVGIPTYDRAATLQRAVDSVLAQSYHNIELVISDNASTDQTQELGRSYQARDGRVRYLRSPANRGPTANFNVLFQRMRGEYVMVLSDDDWLEQGYVADCLAELVRRPELVLVGGVARYLRDGAQVGEGAKMQLQQDSPRERVLGYLREVDENGVFYGLMPRAVLQRAAPLRNTLGNDWLLSAAVIAQGKIATLQSTAINRELGGTSADFTKLTATLGLPGWQARVAHLVIAGEIIADVGWRAPAYRELGRAERARLALAGAWAVISWRSLAWHLTMPAFAAAGRHAGGRWAWKLYLSITRRLGAGRSR